MNILFIDTCSDTCGVAVGCGDRLLAQTVFRNEKALSARLLDSVHHLLKDAGMTLEEVDCFGVTTGPGSFTGLRIGVSTVKGLALALGKPVVGVSSLAVLAMNLPCAPFHVCAMLDARKKEVYAGIYDPAEPGRAVVPDSVAPAADFLRRIDGKVIFLGPGAAAYAETIRAGAGEDALFAPLHCNTINPAAGCALVHAKALRGETLSPAALGPAYIRPSEAEIAAKRIDALLC